MASRLSSFHLPPSITSSLLKNPPDAVPPTDELERLFSELKHARQRAADRGRKADEDLRTIEESMRRMAEKEKGKSKAVEKVKRERDFTPILDAEESRTSSLYQSSSSKSRNNSHSANALPSSSRSSVDPRRSAADEIKKKKKKRKREGGDSDVEPEHQRPRKATPPVVHPTNHVQPPKPPKPSVTATVPHNKSIIGPDFSVPPTQQLLPPRPPIPPPPIPGPSKPTDVTEDFSKAKQPPPILVSTFYTSIEPYTRNIKEEDIGFLDYTGDEVEPYVMPKLGRHYLETWEDQDAGILPALLLGENAAPPSSFAAPAPKFDPSTLSDQELLTEEKGHGPLIERVISALIPAPDIAQWKGVKAAEDAMEGRPGGSGAAAARRERLNVTDLEARIRDTMRYHGLIDTAPDFTEKVDDPIASALRDAQRELRHIVATNKARKARLAAIARDRLGYQEYLELRDSIDKNITTLYAKLQKKDTPKLSKKKKKPLQGAAATAAANAAANAAQSTAISAEDVPLSSLAPCPAALGLTPDEDNHLTVNEQLKQLVETRRQWVDTVGAIFDEKERENPGRIYGLPKESIYLGVEEEVRAVLAGQASNAPVPNHSVMNGVVLGGATMTMTTAGGANGVHNGVGFSRTNVGNKGKDRARNDAMDIG